MANGGWAIPRTRLQRQAAGRRSVLAAASLSRCATSARLGIISDVLPGEVTKDGVPLGNGQVCDEALDPEWVGGDHGIKLWSVSDLDDEHGRSHLRSDERPRQSQAPLFGLGQQPPQVCTEVCLPPSFVGMGVVTTNVITPTVSPAPCVLHLVAPDCRPCRSD